MLRKIESFNLCDIWASRIKKIGAFRIYDIWASRLGKIRAFKFFDIRASNLCKVRASMIFAFTLPTQFDGTWRGKLNRLYLSYKIIKYIHDDEAYTWTCGFVRRWPSLTHTLTHAHTHTHTHINTYKRIFQVRNDS